MDFISNQEPQIQEMLKDLGIRNVENLFQDIPEELRLARPTIDDGMSEYEGAKWVESLASQNTYPSFENYLGAGAYEHYVPAIVSAICGKSEFLTSYTPYQAEASQGMLQAIFEFQSVICALTGMDVSNASVYDGASACAEAVLMAMRCQKERSKILLGFSLHPHYRAVIKQYVHGHDVQILEIPFLPSGEIDPDKLHEMLDEQVAAVLIQSPNFFGVVENMQKIVPQAKKVGALVIQCANPLAYGLFASAGENGVDIAVGDSQPFGLSLNFGGPYAGYMACHQSLVRQLPGRIVGETVDTGGKRGFVLTLQAREQHIRREKATSNICTNQALAALGSLIAMLWYGKEGIPQLALTNFQRTSYLKKHLENIEGVETFNTPFFNEFLVRFPGNMQRTQTLFRNAKIEPGLDMGKFYPEMQGWMLVAVTETKSKAQLDHYLTIAGRSV